MDQKCFAAFESSALNHVVPDGEESLRDGRGLDHWQSAERQSVAFMRETIFSVAAADHQSKNAITDFPAFDVRSECYDLARDLKAWNIRRAGRRRIEALPLHHVRPVDAGGRHLHENLARSGRGNRTLFGNKHFRPTGSLDSDDGHAGG